MADAINRVVPSAVATDHAFWQGRERQKRREKDPRSGTKASDESAGVNATAGTEPVRQESRKDKGKHLDISV